MCNVSTAVVKYSKVTRSILTEAARRKLFANNLASDVYVVQGSTDEEVLPRCQAIREAEASPRIVESTITSRNPDTLRLIATR